MQLANHVRIGVEPASLGQLADADNAWLSSYNVHWVEIDGTRVPGVIQSARIDFGAGFHSLEITLICGKVETVDHREQAE